MVLHCRRNGPFRHPLLKLHSRLPGGFFLFFSRAAFIECRSVQSALTIKASAGTAIFCALTLEINDIFDNPHGS
jgi:hypothetical protein